MSGRPPSPHDAASQRRKWTDVGPRVISAAVLVAITAISLYVGSYFFAAVVGVVYAGAYREWETMVTRTALGPGGMMLIGLVALSGLAFPLAGWAGIVATIGPAIVLSLFMGLEYAPWRIGGLALFGLLIGAVITLRGTGTDGIMAGIYLGTVVWTTDSAAFFSGRQIGGEKLAPIISPSKTWSGAVGGLAMGTVAGLVVWLIVTESPWWIGLLLSMSISLAGQAGDLGESALKRHFRIKDSGDIIPGHGGLMDRMDSLTFGVILVFIVGALHAGFGSVARGLLYW